MASTPVAIGPFFGGLNDAMDPSNIEDNQCSALLNFDVDVDGSIVTRPGCAYLNTATSSSRSHYILGTFSSLGQTFMIVLARQALQATRENLIAIDVDTMLRTTITSNDSNVRYIASVQYDNKLWVVSDNSTVPGGYWTASGGWVEVTAMPRGIAALVYKERMFIISETGRVYFSKIADFTQWEASGFFDVNPGDGQKMRAAVSYMGQIVLFKEHSTYVFAYDSAPERATIQQVSATIGTESMTSVVIHENLIYTFHNYKMYAINNWRWQDVSYKIRIHDPATSIDAPQSYRAGTASLSSVGRRVILRYRTQFWSYYPDLEAWSKWELDKLGGSISGLIDGWDRFVLNPVVRTDGFLEYWTGCFSKVAADGNEPKGLWKFIDGFVENLDDETQDPLIKDIFTSQIASKMYDYDMPYNFKRLHWWGVDLITKRTVSAMVYPETYNTVVTWDQLEAAGQTWDYYTTNNRTWNRLVDIAVNVSDSYTMAYTTGVRTFLRFLKSLRFRKIVYEITYRQNASSAEGPLRIFTAMAVVSAKQLGPRKAN